jgi:ABC-type Zn uptake system ZnuABC Zn-binding protein ZnuA
MHRFARTVSIVLCCWAWLAGPAAAQEPHRVVATTPDLGALCAAVGGEHVAVTTLVKGPEDPHVLEPRPSMVRAVSRAEALVEVGRELESGWLPSLVDNARNGAVLAGRPGRIDASAAVRAIGVPGGRRDRSRGDVHAAGNPHYLADPLCGLQVAALLRDRFATLWPAQRGAFEAGFAALRRRVAAAMVGTELAQRYEHDAERLAILFGKGQLDPVLREQGDLELLAGWFGAMRPFRGARVVADHDIWPYFAERFGLDVIAFFEPGPGIAPTTRHLETVVAAVRELSATAILSAPFFAPQHAELVARTTVARIAAMAHQTGAVARGDVAAEDAYVAFVDHNVRAVAAALQTGTAAKH